MHKIPTIQSSRSFFIAFLLASLPLAVLAYDPMEGLWFKGGYIRTLIDGYVSKRLYEVQKTKPEKKDIELVKKQILEDGFTFEEFKITTEDCCSIKVLIIPSNDPLSKKTKIFFHGSTGGIGSMMPEVQDAYERGFNSVLLSYRGYSDNPGKPSQKGIAKDMTVAHRFIKKHLDLKDTDIYVHAHSMGCAVALAFASKLAKNGQTLNEILLHAPFYSFKEMAYFRLPQAPEWLIDKLIANIWNNQKALKETANDLKLKKLSYPKLRFFYSDADSVVPLEQSIRLENYAKEYGFDTSHSLLKGYEHSDSLYDLVYESL